MIAFAGVDLDLAVAVPETLPAVAAVAIQGVAPVTFGMVGIRAVPMAPAVAAAAAAT